MSNDAYLLEDGSGHYLLEDASGIILKETNVFLNTMSAVCTGVATMVEGVIFAKLMAAVAVGIATLATFFIAGAVGSISGMRVILIGPTATKMKNSALEIGRETTDWLKGGLIL